jgi:hypothetical protein
MGSDAEGDQNATGEMRRGSHFATLSAQRKRIKKLEASDGGARWTKLATCYVS